MTARAHAAPGRANRLNIAIAGILRVGGREYPCETLNISRTGALLSGDFPVPLQGPVDLTLKGTATMPQVRLGARVARLVRPEQGAAPLVAVQFDREADEAGDALETLFSRLVEEIQAPSGAIEALRPGAPPHEVRRVLASIPLATRIALSTRGSAREREFLRQDTNPAVLDALGRNANLLESEAASLLSSPLLAPRTLEHLAADPRWVNSPAIRTAIVTHPRTPIRVAEELVLKLGAGALHRIVRMPGLNPAIRERVAKKLARGR